MLNVCSLFEFAKQLELTKLLRCLERNIVTSPITSASAPYLLEVAFTQLEENADVKQNLKERALSFVVEHMDSIDFTVLETMPAVIGATVLVGLQQILQSPNYSSIFFDTRTTYESTTRSPLSTRVENIIRPDSNKTKSKKSKEQKKDKVKSVRLQGHFET